MPVYEISYKSWDGKLQPMIYRLLTFPKYTFMQMMNRKMIYTTFILAWLPFILFMTYIYIRLNVPLLKSLNIPVNVIPAVNEKFFLAFILIQLPFLFFFTLAFGPPLISTDLKNKALPMILSKPINKWEYVLGKFLILFLLMSTLTWVQGLILFVANTAAVPSADPWRQMFFTETLPILFKIIIFSLIIIVTLNLLVLMFSSITSTPSFASVSFIMFIIGTFIAGGILKNIFKTSVIFYISPLISIYEIGGGLFNDTNRADQVVYAWIFLTGIWGLCLFVLSKRIKAFQIFKE